MYPEIQNYRDKIQRGLVTVKLIDTGEESEHPSVFESTIKQFKIDTGEETEANHYNFTLQQLEDRQQQLQEQLEDINQLIIDVKALQERE